MSCHICHRSSCVKSFHSLESQERFNKKQEMSDDIDTLREEIIFLKEQINTFEKEIDSLKDEIISLEKRDI